MTRACTSSANAIPGSVMKSFDPVFPPNKGPLGIYIHVPFCRGRCNYCAFVTNPYRPDLAERYADSVIKEIRLWGNGPGAVFILNDAEVDTIYFGGGTPSLLAPPKIAELIEAVRSSFQVIEAPEITMEINPGTCDRSAIWEFRQAGVNRASLGVQSLRDTELAAMGRLHDAKQAITTYHDLRDAGFENISVDLIAGFQCQSRKSLRDTLEKVAELQPEHLSIYLLELKSGTKLNSMIRDGQMPPLDDDLSADLYEDICLFAETAGYQHYEISNFARNRRFALHNLKYWQDRLYIGCGSGAHGMTGRGRYANLENLEDYEQAVGEDRLPFQSLTEMTPMTRFKDALIMGLRLVNGIDLELLGKRYQVDALAFVMDTIGDLEPAGLFVLDRDNLVLTSRGRLLSNVVFSRWV
ncbi:MAG: radical SAM family heme chaperone HemW [Desulfomonilaceae bacterium]